MKQKYEPATIIGLGGAGIRALRFLLTISDKDPELQSMIKNEELSLLGFDTDPRSNKGSSFFRSNRQISFPQKKKTKLL